MYFKNKIYIKIPPNRNVTTDYIPKKKGLNKYLGSNLKEKKNKSFLYAVNRNEILLFFFYIENIKWILCLEF